MLMLTRFNPTTDRANLSRRMERLFDEMLGHGLWRTSDERPLRGSWVPAINILEREDAVEITADLPGLQAEDVEVTVDEGTLSIRGERKLIYRGKSELREVEGMEVPSDPANLESPTLAEAIGPLVTTRTGFFLVEVEVTMRDVTRVFRIYYKRVNQRLFRLSLAEIQPSRLPLQDQGVDVEDFDPYLR